MSRIGAAVLNVPIVRRAVARAASWYKASVGAELRRYGLRYDDVICEEEPDVKKVIENLSPLEAELRHKRIKRAIDLDVKKTYLPEELQAQVDVWNPYIRDRVAKLKQERMERQTYE